MAILEQGEVSTGGICLSVLKTSKWPLKPNVWLSDGKDKWD